MHMKKLLKKLLLGLFLEVIACWLVIQEMNVNPYNEYLLIQKGVTVNALITDSTQYQTDVTIPDYRGGGSEEVTNTYYSYKFVTCDGITIKDGSSELNLSGLNNNIQVEYLPSNPKINRVKGMGNQCATIGEFILRRIIGGLVMLSFFVPFGIYTIKNAMKEYKKNDKEKETINSYR